MDIDSLREKLVDGLSTGYYEPPYSPYCSVQLDKMVVVAVKVKDASTRT